MNAEEVRRAWASRSAEYSPGYYAYYGPNETSERVRRVLDRLVGREASVLEVGCSAGRHLEHLREHGYRDLHGLDINAEAFEVMAETYPELADEVAFYRGDVGERVEAFAEDRFDAVFSVRTLQHVHPDDVGAFDELARVAGDALVTVEREAPGEGVTVDPGGDGRGSGADPAVNYVDDDVPLFYRDWGAVFTGAGMVEVESAAVGEDTLRAFRPAG